MTKAKISEYDAVAANNTDVNGVNIAENCPPSGMNNMGREIMAALKRFQTGADGDSVTVGGSLVVSNTLTSGPVSATTLNTSGAVVFNDAGADVDFRVEGDTDANLLFVDASADAVGIRKSSPSAPLDVQRSAVTYPALSTDTVAIFSKNGNALVEIITDPASQSILYFSDSDQRGQGAFFYDHPTDSLRVQTAGAERMRIDSSGNLLVGTTTSAFGTLPRIEIRVADGRAFGVTNSGTGTATAAIFLNNAGSLVGEITFTTTTTTYATSSDYRLKENVAPMTGALAKVLELNPVTYTWKADGSAGEGFIAHELQEVAPYAVSGEKDGEEMQGVDYGKITPLLTAALQEAITEIQSLKARVAELEAK